MRVQQHTLQRFILPVAFTAENLHVNHSLKDMIEKVYETSRKIPASAFTERKPSQVRGSRVYDVEELTQSGWQSISDISTVAQTSAYTCCVSKASISMPPESSTGVLKDPARTLGRLRTTDPPNSPSVLSTSPMARRQEYMDSDQESMSSRSRGQSVARLPVASTLHAWGDDKFEAPTSVTSSSEAYDERHTFHHPNSSVEWPHRPEIDSDEESETSRLQSFSMLRAMPNVSHTEDHTGNEGEAVTLVTSLPFTKNEFMSNDLFHLNSFVDSGQRINYGFTAFMQQQAATVGISKHEFTPEVLQALSSSSREEIADMVVENTGVSHSAAGQIVLWQLGVQVGSFVIMRHAYKECPYIPQLAFDDHGRWLGKLYVIGQVTQLLQPFSEEDNCISNQYPETHGKEKANGFHRVNFCRMGLESSLSKVTQCCLNAVCVKMLAQISFSSSTAHWIRSDLWNNATRVITPDDAQFAMTRGVIL